MEKERALQRAALFSVALFWFSQNIFTPFLSPYILSLGFSPSQAGVIIGAYGVSQILLRVPTGVIGNTPAAQRKLIVFGFASIIAHTTVMFFATEYYLLILSRFIAGVSAATWVSFSIYFQNCSGNSGVKSSARMMSANYAGAIAASVIGATIYNYSSIKPLIIISAVSAAAGMAVMLCSRHNSEPFSGCSPHLQKAELKKVFKYPALLISSTLSILSHFILSATRSSFVTNYLVDSGFSGPALSVLVIAPSVSQLAAAVALTKGKNKSNTGILILGFCLMSLHCALVASVSSPAAVLILQLSAGAGCGMIDSVLINSAVSGIPAHDKSCAMGVFQSLYAIGMVAGPIVAGRLLEATGRYDVLFPCVGAAGIAAIIITMLCKRRGQISAE